MSTKETSYNLSDIEGASSIGLMVVLFDTLARDFRRALTALNHNDIDTSCKQLNHAALVVGQLDSWVDLEKGGESARNLAGFYAYLCAKMMQAAASRSSKPLEAPIEMLQQVKTAWQKLDTAARQRTEKTTGTVTNIAAPTSGKKQEAISSPRSR